MQNPPDVDTYPLGEQKSVHTFSSVRFTFAVIGLLLIAIFFTWILLGVLTDGKSPLYLAIVPAIIGLGGFVYIALLVKEALANAPLMVTVYENGFVYKNREVRQIVRWDEIETVWSHILRANVQGVPLLLGFKMKIRCVDGRELRIPRQMEKVFTLAWAIIKPTIDRLGPSFVARAEKGEMLNFGNQFQMTQNELIVRGRKIPWSKLTGIQLQQSSVSVFVKGDILFNLRNSFVTTPMYQVPNLYVMLAVSQYFLEKHRAMAQRSVKPA